MRSSCRDIRHVLYMIRPPCQRNRQCNMTRCRRYDLAGGLVCTRLRNSVLAFRCPAVPRPSPIFLACHRTPSVAPLVPSKCALAMCFLGCAVLPAGPRVALILPEVVCACQKCWQSEKNIYATCTCVAAGQPRLRASVRTAGAKRFTRMNS